MIQHITQHCYPPPVLYLFTFCTCPLNQRNLDHGRLSPALARSHKRKYWTSTVKSCAMRRQLCDCITLICMRDNGSTELWAAVISKHFFFFRRVTLAHYNGCRRTEDSWVNASSIPPLSSTSTLSVCIASWCSTLNVTAVSFKPFLPSQTTGHCSLTFGGLTHKQCHTVYDDSSRSKICDTFFFTAGRTLWR